MSHEEAVSDWLFQEVETGLAEAVDRAGEELTTSPGELLLDRAQLIEEKADERTFRRFPLRTAVVCLIATGGATIPLIVV